MTGQTTQAQDMSLQPSRESVVALPSPEQLAQRLPLTASDKAAIKRSRHDLRKILRGEDNRLAVVVGPCSIHDVGAALDYAERLARLQEDVADTLQLVMRVYVEKPRTTVGWKGLAYDPHLDGSHDLAFGLEQSRHLMREVVRSGLAVATEALSPIVTRYLQDMLSWVAIGARTTESQIHREMASGLDAVIGFKNSTEGCVQIAIDAMRASRASQMFPTVLPDGRVGMVTTPGNPDTHLILRGGRQGTNYDADSVREASARMLEAGLRPRLMIDASHGNSGKDYRNQSGVLASVRTQLAHGAPIMGVMVESFIEEGRQDLTNRDALRYGQSITDACIGWEQTRTELSRLAEVVAAR
ncbi:3-deoxy-7-phosphoheptulonate synthase [Hahella sp. SMD15-11]|uniref:Phospho-2-dehydro-3-deoxyheptonate aldolase n=1 Tax=Thermohahella caldifontis TaxID=3142973 RepID=A0AB39UVT4_9GAMM